MPSDLPWKVGGTQATCGNGKEVEIPRLGEASCRSGREVVLATPAFSSWKVWAPLADDDYDEYQVSGGRGDMHHFSKIPFSSSVSLSSSSSSWLIPSWWWVGWHDPHKQAGNLPRQCSHHQHHLGPAHKIMMMMIMIVVHKHHWALVIKWWLLL